MIKMITSCIAIACLVMGCANGTDYGDYTQSIDTSNQSGQSALTAYFNKKTADNKEVFKALSGSTNPLQAQNNQMAIVLYTILSQQNDEKVLAYFVPKYAAKPTTNGDIGMSLSNNFLPTLVKVGAGVWLGGQIVDGLQTTSTVLGAGASLTNQTAGQNITGGPSISASSLTNDTSQATNGSFNPTGDNITPNNQFQPSTAEPVVIETLPETVLE